MQPCSSILERLTQVMRDCFDDDEIDATLEMTAADVEGWDSLVVEI